MPFLSGAAEKNWEESVSCKYHHDVGFFSEQQQKTLFQFGWACSADYKTTPLSQARKV